MLHAHSLCGLSVTNIFAVILARFFFFSAGNVSFQVFRRVCTVPTAVDIIFAAFHQLQKLQSSLRLFGREVKDNRGEDDPYPFQNASS